MCLPAGRHMGAVASRVASSLLVHILLLLGTASLALSIPEVISVTRSTTPPRAPLWLYFIWPIASLLVCLVSAFILSKDAYRRYLCHKTQLRHLVDLEHLVAIRGRRTSVSLQDPATLSPAFLPRQATDATEALPWSQGLPRTMGHTTPDLGMHRSTPTPPIPARLPPMAQQASQYMPYRVPQQAMGHTTPGSSMHRNTPTPPIPMQLPPMAQQVPQYMPHHAPEQAMTQELEIRQIIIPRIESYHPEENQTGYSTDGYESFIASTEGGLANMYGTVSQYGGTEADEEGVWLRGAELPPSAGYEEGDGGREDALRILTGRGGGA